MIGTIILVILPEIAAPLAAWSTFLYAFLLLVIVLAMPGGIAVLLDFNNRRPLEKHRTVAPQTALLAALNQHQSVQQSLGLQNIVLSFGSVRAIDGVTLDVKPGKIHGLIGPNGSGKTTTLNVISGYYSPNQGTLTLGTESLPAGMPHVRASRGLSRTFQTPRIVGEISVLENVMIGGATKGHANFLQALLAMPQERHERKALKERATALLQVVGLGALAHVRTDRLQHSELRFIEIARALMIAPDFLMLDEPAAGLSNDEIKKLGALIQAISACGTGVLLVEHHVDLIFEICDDVTVLNLGKILAAGTPDEIRAHKEVVNAYLGG